MKTDNNMLASPLRISRLRATGRGQPSSALGHFGPKAQAESGSGPAHSSTTHILLPRNGTFKAKSPPFSAPQQCHPTLWRDALAALHFTLRQDLRPQA